MNQFAKSQGLHKRSLKKIRSKELLQQLKRGQLPPGLPKAFLFKKLRYELTEQEADRIIGQLDDETFEFISGVPLADSYASFCKDVGVFVDDLNSEIKWIARSLGEYAPELEEFAFLQNQYDTQLLLGDYAAALTTIERIEQDISYSNWTLQQKLIIAEFEKGFKANKNLLSELLSDENSTVTNFISSYTSIRIEKNISPLQYDNILKDYLAVVEESLRDFIRLKVDFFKTFGYKDYSSILNIESRQTIIDQFVAFKQVAKLLLCQKEIETKYKNGTIIQSIKHLQPLIPNDSGLRILSVCCDVLPAPSTADAAFLELADLYTDGLYQTVTEKAPEFIRQNPSSYHAILLYVKSVINTQKPCIKFSPNSDCIVDQLIGHIFRILKKDDEYFFECFGDAYKFVHQLGDHPLANGLYYLLTQELPFRFDGERQINLYKYYLMSSATLNPVLNQFMPSSSQTAFFNQITEQTQQSATIVLIKRVQAMHLQFDDPRLTVRDLKYLALVLENNKRYPQALQIYQRIFNSSEYKALSIHAHYKLDILIGIYHCLFKMGNYIEAMELSAAALIDNEYFKERFFYPLLLQIIMTLENEEIHGNIYIPVFLAFYRSNIESYDLYVACDNYLESKGVERPSAYIKLLTDYTSADICFLEKVCTHDVLHSSPAFENQEELDLERLEICSFLLGKTKNIGAIESEISELWRKILVRKGIKQINFSKIYVDISGLKELLRTQLRENFNRNIEIAALPPDQLQKIVDNLGNILVYYFEKDEESDGEIDQHDEEKVAENLKNLKLTSYNRFLHFSEAFLTIRDQFIDNKDHGLDTYLSMRIRHGTLLGQIRSVFETHNLITVKNETGNEYLPNEYWIKRFDNASMNDVLNETLGKFSKQIDELAEKLKVETLQIRTEKNKSSTGLFDFSYDRDALLKLFQEKFGAIKDFEVFMEKCIDELWVKTELGLQNIKKYLNGQLISNLENIFSEVENKLGQLVFLEGDSAYNALQDLISTLRQCQTAITIEMGNIAEWFNRSNKKIIEEFDFTLLIDSNVNTLQNVNPLFAGAQIKTSNNCELILDGDLFPHFTDILYYLLENALKHSKLKSRELWIALEVEQREERIIFRVSNNISNEPTHIEKTINSIAATKKKIASEKTYEDVNKEGGTGFPKIKKILKHDVKRKDFSINLDLVEHDTNGIYFSTEISFEIANLPIILK